MKSTDSVVKQYSYEGHPLGRSLEQGEATLLVEPLRQRLQAGDKELDLSPVSLKRLERKLVEHHEDMQSHGIDFTDDELVLFVREIAAYLGLVLAHHANGEWMGRAPLWSSEIVIHGPIRVVDGRESYTSAAPMIIFLGHIAGASWELIEGE